MRSSGLYRVLTQFLLPALVLLVLLVYTYARFFVIPYLGFQYFGTGEVRALFTPAAAEQIHLGDFILEANGVPFEDYDQSLTTNWFEGFHVAIGSSCG